jgi:tungstate transport system substrate-binding protein
MRNAWSLFRVTSVLFGTFLFATGANAAQERLRMATTTSVQDSGLMAYLLPRFEAKCGCKIDVIAVGTGQALKLGADGDIDLVVVHDPQSEKKFVADGYGIERRTFMMNDFVIVGPTRDPAGVWNLKDAAQALAKIAKAREPFVSRGDESGTHLKEKYLWREAGIQPSGSWYLEIGQGMGAAYTLSDRATYSARMDQLRLQVLVEGDPDLTNYYSAILVNPLRHSVVKVDLARRLVDWFCSSEGQKLIGDYSVGGRTLFKPTIVSGK